MSLTKLLLVEDEEHLAFTVAFNLRAEGFDVHVAPTLGEARSALDATPHDLIILDVMLPDGDGMDFCQSLRESGDLTPVLMLTAKGSGEDIVTGLEMGADDYLTKPFALAELLGRIGALLRRRRWATEHAPLTGESFSFGGHKVDFGTCEVYGAGGERAEITELELRLLRFFINHEGKAISRKILLEEVWGLSGTTNTRTVDNFIVRLRRLFEPDPARPCHFLTVRGIGYRFISQP